MNFISDYISLNIDTSRKVEENINFNFFYFFIFIEIGKNPDIFEEQYRKVEMKKDLYIIFRILKYFY